MNMSDIEKFTETQISGLDSYVGNYICVKDFGCGDVISFGEDAVKTYNDAVTLGYDDPVILFVGDGLPQITRL